MCKGDETVKTIRNVSVGVFLAGAMLVTTAFGQKEPDRPANSSAAAGFPSYGQPGTMQPSPYWGTSQGHSESANLAQQYIKSEKNDEKKEIRTKLNGVLGQQFDQHIGQQQKELEQLEQQLASLKAVIRKRLESKESIIERRAEQLIQEAQGLGWTSPAQTGAFTYGGSGVFRPALGGPVGGQGIGALPKQH
jgi:hypothetical protein